MQRCNCQVRLGGDVRNTVFKTNATPAEIAVLTHIHGEGSVIDIQRTSMCKTPHAQERARLRIIYGAPVIERLFPGEFTKLPVDLADVSTGESDDEEVAEDTDGAEVEGAVDEGDDSDEDEGGEGGEAVQAEGGEAADRRAADAKRKRDARAAKRALDDAMSQGGVAAE